MEIDWPLICRKPGFVWGVEGRIEGNGGTFFEVYRGQGLKVNGGMNKVMVVGGEERVECEVCIDGI